MEQNFAQQWAQSTRIYDTTILKKTGLPRDYMRTLRAGGRIPMFNVNGCRLPASEDSRWLGVANMAFPDNEVLRKEFVDALVALQTRERVSESEGSEETATSADPFLVSDTAPEAQPTPVQQAASGLMITIGKDFQGTVTFTWGEGTYVLTRMT